MIISVNVNGSDYNVECQPGENLLDFIRNRLGLTGTKRGCGEGYCGACTVLIDGKPTNSCMVLAAEVNGKKILTIEGVENNPKWKIFQEKLVENSTGQCGFCIPGMIMNAVSAIDEDPDVSEEDMKIALAGNLCRCGSHHKVIKSVKEYQAEINK